MAAPQKTPSPEEAVDDAKVDAFLEFMRVEKDASDRTGRNYLQALNRFRKRHPLGFKSWEQCQPDDFRAYLFEMMKEERARSTIRLHFAALRSFYKFLCHRHGLEPSPLANVQLPKLEKKLPVVLTLKQIEELLALPLKIEQPKQAASWVGERDAAILELFYSTGMRLEELAKADIADLDTYQETMRVIGKGRKRTPLPCRPSRARGHPALQAESRRARRTDLHFQAGQTHVTHIDSQCGKEVSAPLRYPHRYQRPQAPPLFRNASVRQWR